jgi:hypothetical protein
MGRESHPVYYFSGIAEAPSATSARSVASFIKITQFYAPAEHNSSTAGLGDPLSCLVHSRKSRFLAKFNWIAVESTQL